MEQDDRRTLGFADLEVLDALAVYLDGLGIRAAGLLFLGEESLLELLDVGVYLLVGYGGFGDNA